jgi:heme-degrading monooxygenase HmoA
MIRPTFRVFWAFVVPPGEEERFEQAYGPDGDWARLFMRAAGYLGTELWLDAGRPGRYVTVDHWRTREAFEEFKDRWGRDYAELDARTRRLTACEEPLGAFVPA